VQVAGGDLAVASGDRVDAGAHGLAQLVLVELRQRADEVRSEPELPQRPASALTGCGAVAPGALDLEADAVFGGVDVCALGCTARVAQRPRRVALILRGLAEPRLGPSAFGALVRDLGAQLRVLRAQALEFGGRRGLASPLPRPTRFVSASTSPRRAVIACASIRTSVRVA